MKQVASLLLAVALVTHGNISVAQPATDSKLRSLIEPTTKEGYEKAISDIDKIPKLKPLTPKDAESVTDFFKGKFYNAAYSQYHCTKVAMQQSSLSATEQFDYADTCYRKAQQDYAKTMKIISQYEALLKATDPRKEAACELKARLFDAEFEFPPYDFLKQSVGQDILYDYAIFSSCLTSIIGQRVKVGHCWGTPRCLIRSSSASRAHICCKVSCGALFFARLCKVL
jgi:hypothetical protein